MTHWILPDNILSLGVCSHFPKDLAISHNNVRSHTEMGNKWLLQGLTQHNLAVQGALLMATQEKPEVESLGCIYFKNHGQRRLDEHPEDLSSRLL